MNNLNRFLFAKYHHCLWRWSTFGLPTYARMGVLAVAGVFIGQFLAIGLWGNPSEYMNLKRNGSLYKRELDNFKRSYYGY